MVMIQLASSVSTASKQNNDTTGSSIKIYDGTNTANVDAATNALQVLLKNTSVAVSAAAPQALLTKTATAAGTIWTTTSGKTTHIVAIQGSWANTGAGAANMTVSTAAGTLFTLSYSGASVSTSGSVSLPAGYDFQVPASTAVSLNNSLGGQFQVVVYYYEV